MARLTVTIPEDERDPDLADKLRSEWPGILQWAIDGCLEWQEHGLAPPQAVRQATEEYLAAEDAVARWIEDRCITIPTCQALSRALYADWRDWAEKAGEFVGAHCRFSQALEDRGFLKFHSRGGATFEKIALKK